MSKTTIQVSRQTKEELDNLQKGDVESYDQTLQRVIRAYDGEPDQMPEEMEKKLKDMNSEIIACKRRIRDLEYNREQLLEQHRG